MSQNGLAPWFQPGNQGNTGDVVAHTPDPTKYHRPDEQQASRLGGLMGGTVIPRASITGASMGFDAGKAAGFVADPDAPGGGAFVDPRTLNNKAIRQAFAQAQGDPFRTYELLGQHVAKPPSVTAPAPTTQALRGSDNPVMPGQYVVPKAGPDGQQMYAQPGNQQVGFEKTGEPQVSQNTTPPVPTPVAAPAPAPVPPPQPSPIPPQHQPPPMQPAPQPIQMPASQVPAFDYEHLADVMIRKMQPPAPEPAPQTPMPDLSQTPSPDEMKAPESDLFQQLQIPFIQGGTAHRPEQDVIFEMPGMGQTGAKYHGVMESGNLVVLVYDTRFEYGTQYIPPDLGDKPITVHCPKMDKKFQACYMGFKFSLGCLDHIILVKAEAEAATAAIEG